MPAKPLTYIDSGVSIKQGDAFVAAIQSHMRRTHGPRVIHDPRGFAGLFRLDYNESLFRRNFKDPVLIACADGVGTKLILANKLDKWDTIGIDLVAMNLNDLVVQGAEPLFFLDYIACGRLDKQRLEQIVKGIADACAHCSCALLGGETAEMPDIYSGDDVDLAGFSVGVADLSRVTDAERVEPGDIVIGLESDGVHSNGFSLVRKAIEAATLDLNESYEDLDPERTLGEVLLTPTRLYARAVARLLRKYKVKRVVSGMAHITGGGLQDNLKRALHADVNAVLSESSWSPHPIFPFLQQRANIEPEEMHRVFNMGIGYCLIVRPTFAASVSRHLARLGERPVTIGKITAGSGSVKLEP